MSDGRLATLLGDGFTTVNVDASAGTVRVSGWRGSERKTYWSRAKTLDDALDQIIAQLNPDDYGGLI